MTDITVEELEFIKVRIAQMIASGADWLVPWFEKIENEQRRLSQNCTSKRRAIELANKYSNFQVHQENSVQSKQD